MDLEAGYAGFVSIWHILQPYSRSWGPEDLQELCSVEVGSTAKHGFWGQPEPLLEILAI